MKSNWKSALCAVTVAALLGGCATCDRHPVACTVATVIVVGSIAASVEHRHDELTMSRRPRHGGPDRPGPGLPIGYPNPPCTPQPDGSCR